MGIHNRRLMAVLLVMLAALLLAACGGASTAADSPATVQLVSPADIAPRLPGDLSQDFIVVDVRTPQEWSEDGHIEGATLIPVDEIPSRAPAELPQDAEIVVYCRSGNRSAQAADWLISNGYTNVKDLGGINDWKGQGYPVAYGQ